MEIWKSEPVTKNYRLEYAARRTTGRFVDAGENSGEMATHKTSFVRRGILTKDKEVWAVWQIPVLYVAEIGELVIAVASKAK
jgi:hypothetical protein